MSTKKFLHLSQIPRSKSEEGEVSEGLVGNTCPATRTSFHPIETRREIVRVTDRESRRLISQSSIETSIFFLCPSNIPARDFFRHHSRRHSTRKKRSGEAYERVDGVCHLGVNISPRSFYVTKEARGKKIRRFSS